MKIGPVSNGLPMRQSERPKAPPPETAPARPDTTDRVEISLDARTRLAELADRELKAHGARVGENPTSPGDLGGVKDRIAEIRQKIESGFYDRPEIRDRIVNNLTDDLEIG